MVPRPESMNRMSMSQINVAFQPDGESQKPGNKITVTAGGKIKVEASN